MGPSQVGGLDISETEDGLVVLNVLSRRVHHLNATAAILFELCTGNNSVTEIEEMMTSIRISLGLPEFDTVDILEMFVREGLIRT